MRHSREQPKFEIQPAVEQKPFESEAVRSFFTKWCEINDSIQPQVLSREQWVERGTKGILEKRSDGKQILFIPEDLQLWEMVGVMEVVDQDTFATKPERAVETKEKLVALGKTFEDAGIYIAKRLGDIDQGREIAEALALEFYEYGQSLTSSKKPEVTPAIEEIAERDLSAEETEKIDRFLAGDALYASRQKIAEEKIRTSDSDPESVYETERQKTLAQFFQVAEKAFMLQKKSERGELEERNASLKPWQNDASIHSAFLRRIERALTKQIETPKREFEMAIFRRGLEKLTSEMRERGWRHGINNFFEKLGLDLKIEQRKLIEALDISKLKADLEAIRKEGDPVRISKKERKIADKIQVAVSSFPYGRKANNPSEIVVNQYINCVGASTLGGALMKEAGLNYLVGDVPGHSILFLVTSNGQVEWRDMRKASSNEALKDKIIRGQKSDGSDITVADIVTFSKKPAAEGLEGLQFDIDDSKYREKFPWVKKDQRQYVVVSKPEYGQQIQILNNTGLVLESLGRKEEAIEAYRQAIAVDPKCALPYSNLGIALEFLGRKEEAIEAFRQAIAVDPKRAYSYNDLGDALESLDRKKEAIEAYRKFIDLANPKRDNSWIKRAEQIIADLEK